MPLSVVQQDALGKEAFIKNGHQVVLHIVSKNHEFNFRVHSSLSFNSVPLVASLQYDGTGKTVECAKGEAMDYSVHLDATGLQAVVESKINVLSSQLADSYFRVVFRQGDESASSHPIQCVSKKGQVLRVLAKLPKVSGVKLSAASKSGSSVPPPTKRRRTSAAAASSFDYDESGIEDRLRAMQEQLHAQQGLLLDLVNARQPSPVSSPPAVAPSAPLDLADALLDAFDRMPGHEREATMRAVLSCPLRASKLANLFELAGGVGASFASASPSSSPDYDPSITSASSPASAFQQSPQLDQDFLLPSRDCFDFEAAAACYSPSISTSESFVA